MTTLPDAGLRERDAAARHAAQTVFDRPLVLEAGAGTGKTTTLVARILAWVLGAGWDEAAAALAEAAAARGEASPPGPERVAARALEGVVAITFTEAAAAEMAHRTAAELTAVAAGAPPGWLEPGPPSATAPADRAAALVATLDHLQVSTIHAFCLGLLAAHPVEAGLHPQLQVDAEGRTVEAVVRETVEAALREAYGDPGDPAFLALAAQGKGPPEIVAALVELIAAGVPASALAADPLAGPEAAAVVARLRDAARAVHALVAPRLGDPNRHLDNARAVRDALAGLVADLDAGLDDRSGQDSPDLAALAARLRDDFPEAHRNRLGEWAKRGGSGKTETAAFADVAAELTAAAGELAPLVEHLCRLEPDLLTAARAVLGPLLAAVERELVARGVLTFQDLLARAAGLLRRRADVRARERRRIRQLLVDEFQDTDRLQCELVGWLALDGPADDRPGLFLVGDPKQSIYGWRSADLASYDAFLERVRAAGGEVHPLVLNFRSPPPILDEVERAIAPVMREERGLQPPFEPLLAREDRLDDAGFTGGGRAAVEYWVSWPAETGGSGAAEDDDEDGGPTAGPTIEPHLEDATRLEAVALARDVVDLHHRRDVPWGEIGILLRSTTDLDLYLEALRERGVPFAVARDKQYYRRREVIEAAALVRAVLDPGDHVALVTVLRSAMVGVPDAALIPLWRRHLPRRLTDLGGGDDPDGRRDRAALAEIAAEVAAAAAELPAGIPGLDRLAGWPAALVAAAEHLARARRAFRREPADRFVDTLRRLFLIEPVEAARYLGSYRLANLDRFFTKLGTVLEAGGGDAAAVLRALRRSVAEALDAQEARPEEGADDAVQVMTIHTAKGLDFGHVYLVQLHKQTGGDREPEVEAAPVGDPGAGIAGWEYRLFGAPTPGFDRVEAQRRRVEAAERVRTLYVAMTRAKERLVLLGRWEADPPLRSVEAARHHLDLLAHRDCRPELGELWAGAHGGSVAAGGSGDAEAAGGRDRHGALWRFPARFLSPAEPAAATDGEEGGPALPSAEAVERAAAELGARRAEAALRAARPVSRAASDDAHRLLRALAAEREEGADEEGRGGEERREAAMAAGAAVHRALELFDLATDPDEEAARQREALAGYLGDAAPADTSRGAGSIPGRSREAERVPGRAPATGRADGTALDRARETFDRFVRGPLLPRLRSLAGHVLARELPVLLPPHEGPAAFSDAGSSGDADGAPPPPVGFVAGTIDLLYRDPESGALVVADYKTDRVESDADLAERVRAYAAQGAVYLRALRDGLDLPALGEKAGQPPEIRFEIWALHAGKVVPVPDPAAPPPPAGPTSPQPAPPPGGRGPGQLDLFPE